MRRLKRYNSTSPARKSGYRSSPSPTPTRRPLNAFDTLQKGAVDEKAKKQKEKGLLLDKSEFVQAEAQESDEDDGFGFAKGDDTEDEASDAENDKPLEGLVNDAEMDAEAEAKEKVVEKFK
jgi:mediator of replication checkpoint protein 1